MTERSSRLIGLNVITNSLCTAKNRCKKLGWVQYDLGLRKIVIDQPLRMGRAIHEALDYSAQAIIDGHNRQDARKIGLEAIDANYLVCPDFIPLREWLGEREICRQLLIGYVWRWQDDDLVITHTEQTFFVPIINPATGRRSTRFVRGGVIDKIGKWHGIPCIVEHKTTGDPIHNKDDGSEPDYWKRLRIDTQISGYYTAALSLGHDVQNVLYDVMHKPGMRPKDKIPCTDERDRKIVIVKATGERAIKKNGDPYASDGNDLHCYEYREETIAEFGERLIADIYKNPDKYYQRKDIPRLQSDLDEYHEELWSQQQSIGTDRNNNWHFRDTNACRVPFPCPIKDLCWSGFDFENEIPPGYEKVESIHPELGVIYDGSLSPSPTATSNPATDEREEDDAEKIEQTRSG